MNTLDVTGDPARIALAWAYAAHAPAGAYWPAAFGIACSRVPDPSVHTTVWLREVVDLAESLVSDLRLMQLEAGIDGPPPKAATIVETDDGGLHVCWDTSVSLVLSTTEEPGRLRLGLYGEHMGRESLAREALESPNQIQDHMKWSWNEIISSLAGAMTLADDERKIVDRLVGAGGDAGERLEVLAAYARARAGAGA